MKSTFSEAQVRGLLSICEHESGDAVRVTVSRLDQTCGGYPALLKNAAGGTYTTVGSKTVGADSTLDFIDNPPPKPDLVDSTAIGTSATVCYKVGLNSSGGTA